jgi:RNA polymerase sigma-70 factor (ECF subfamily)
MGRRRDHQTRHRDAYAGDAIDRREPLDWLLAEEQQQLVRRALAELPRRDAEILLLKYTENWSYQELAHHLGATSSAIESRLHRAREKMRQVMARVAPEYVPNAEASRR